MPFATLLEELLEWIQPDAEYFDCLDEIAHAREILSRGTSAHRQIATYQQVKSSGADDQEALRAVVDMLIEDSSYGL